ncbi:MAG: DUF501 domain-containing protein [Gaiellaceae bacterium]
MDDRSIVAAQIGREPRAFSGVAVRCPFGFPAVSEQRPYDDEGKPFPTGFYLTCPELAVAVARLEAAGGVERWSERVSRSRRLRWSLWRAGRKQRHLRAESARSNGRMLDGGASLKLGIGGSKNARRLKCLHAHVAFALANPGYTLGESIVRELEPLWPENCHSHRSCGTHASSASDR